jgi:hypothetical protein
MAKIGRNEPCPCGSGKKYKRCCYGKDLDDAWPLETEATLPQESAATSAPESAAKDPELVKIRRTEAELMSRVLDFAASSYGREFFEQALGEFSLWGEYEVAEDDFDNFFFPWLAFNWVPEGEEAGSDDGARLAVALEYLHEHFRDLDSYQQAFIREACAQPFSFFAVTEVSQGVRLTLRDVFLSRTVTVKEILASRVLKRGDIIFSRIIELEGQAIMFGVAPTALPPRLHNLMLDLRDELKKEVQRGNANARLSQPMLLEFDFDMRAAYFRLAESLYNPRLPEVQNTDGEEITFVKLYFKLNCSPREAVEDLKSLSLPEFRDNILESALFDKDGNLTEVTFGWHKRGNKRQKHLSNTTLGTLKVKGDVLVAEVNSEQRARKIKAEITKRLKERASFQRAVHESVESKLEEMQKQAGSPEFERRRRESEELQSRPEVQEILRKHMEAHWEAWYNERIPALNNKTPLEAARTKSGRERLEALLLEYERNNERVDPHLRVDIAAMRSRLGL